MTPDDCIVELEAVVAQRQALVAQLRERVTILLAENQACESE
jgi:uncharacterized coiled-coil protein SlyX